MESSKLLIIIAKYPILDVCEALDLPLPISTEIKRTKSITVWNKKIKR